MNTMRDVPALARRLGALVRSLSSRELRASPPSTAAEGSLGYAVIDLETTGVGRRSNRIVEIAIVHCDPDGRITGGWQTLVHPGRDLGPVHVHGLRGAEMRDAPRFEQIADQVRELLDGRIVVAHNAAFDAAFLAAEWRRAGCLQSDELPVPALCTMRLAAKLLPGRGRGLGECCEAFGIRNRGAHSAFGDAEATARLLAAYLRAHARSPVWAEHPRTPFRAAMVGTTGQRARALPRELAQRTVRPTAPSRRAAPLRPGVTVVLTGRMRLEREEWERRLTARGCVVQPRVTKATELLVAADPDSLSKKADTARRYGTPIVDEAWLERQLG
ncbi:MAG: exonuclease domain-containing protein [Pseudoclavibacter sp.]|nr:exonuclease domain-containing protein [Pseudoclavibacter sp.]